MAKSTKRANDHKTRKPGKETIGWEKLGIYLSPAASERLSLHSIKKDEDRSTILNHLVLNHLRAYTIAVDPIDRREPAVDVNLAAAVLG
jgi:hypothetical protein